jgi:tRNA-specific 2-thiouridylase
MRGVDGDKDQSYVLFPVDGELLDRMLLPIGDLRKEDVRREAERFGLAVHDKPDSLDICFVPDRDYARVVRERRPEAFVAGEVRDSAGQVLGRHDGTPSFTIGQRRGLGIAAGKPVYVTEINVSDHAVTVGPREELMSAGLEASRMNWLGPPAEAGQRVHAQIRYAHKAAPAVVRAINGDGCDLAFDEPQPAITPGQAVVLYDGDVVLGGGWIDRAVKR